MRVWRTGAEGRVGEQKYVATSTSSTLKALERAKALIVLSLALAIALARESYLPPNALPAARFCASMNAAYCRSSLVLSTDGRWWTRVAGEGGKLVEFELKGCRSRNLKRSPTLVINRAWGVVSRWITVFQKVFEQFVALRLPVVQRVVGHDAHELDCAGRAVARGCVRPMCIVVLVL